MATLDRRIAAARGDLECDLVLRAGRLVDVLAARVDQPDSRFGITPADYLAWRVRSPNFPEAKVTLAQLLSHRSGLRDHAGYVIPLGESLEAKLKDPKAWYADAPPGEAPFAYANLDYILHLESSNIPSSVRGSTLLLALDERSMKAL